MCSNWKDWHVHIPWLELAQNCFIVYLPKYCKYVDCGGGGVVCVWWWCRLWWWCSVLVSEAGSESSFRTYVSILSQCDEISIHLLSLEYTFVLSIWNCTGVLSC